MLEHGCQDNNSFIQIYNKEKKKFPFFFPNLQKKKKKKKSITGSIPQNKMPTTSIEDWVVKGSLSHM